MSGHPVSGAEEIAMFVVLWWIIPHYSLLTTRHPKAGNAQRATGNALG